jgi:hypothetical protein
MRLPGRAETVAGDRAGTTMRMGDLPPCDPTTRCGYRPARHGALMNQSEAQRCRPCRHDRPGRSPGGTVTHGITSMVLNQCRSRVSLNGCTVGVVDSTSSSCSSGLLFKTVGPQPGKYQGVRLATRWLSASVAVISAHGEIDAFNANNLTEYALGPLRRCRALILELSGLNFCPAPDSRRCTRLTVAAPRWASVGSRYPAPRCPGYCSSAIRTARCPPQPALMPRCNGR